MENTSIDNAIQTAALMMAESYVNRYSSTYDIATLFIHAGKKDEALYWLKESIDVLDPKVHFLNADPDFQSLRNDQRFIEYVKIVGLKP